MSKELKELFESSVLDEDTKTAIQEAFDAKITKIEEEKEAEYAEKLVEARSTLTEMLPEIVQEAVEAELGDIKDELVEARSLDERYAEKLVTFKEQYAEKAGQRVDEAIRQQVEKEINELRESIEEARENEFGRKIFEQFKDQFVQEFSTVTEGAESAEDLKQKLKESQEELEKYQRKDTIEGLLEGLTGKRREVVKTMLEDVDTDKLESRFERIMESYTSDSDSETGDESLTEETGSESEEQPSGKVVLEEDYSDEDGSGLSDKDFRNIRRMAGLG